MQYLVGGDNNRTPVKFKGSDNLVFVGEVPRYIDELSGMKYAPARFRH